jgi:shikimate dehydrogenase
VTGSAAGRHRAAVLGSPIEHSLSPVLHRAAYAALGLADWTYDAVDCDRAALPDTLARLAPTHAGVSLTMPLKEAVLPLLAEVDPLARKVGAVNTVLFGETAWTGANTDVAGIEAALGEVGVDLGAATVVVLGGGGTARAVLAALGRRGARTVTLYARRPGHVTALADVAAAFGSALAIEPWPGAVQGVLAADLVVSTTPAGATDVLADEGWVSGTALLDVLYDPWPTRLAATALDAGARVVGGLSVLVAQAVEQVRLMTGLEPPDAVMRAAGEQALLAR